MGDDIKCYANPAIAALFEASPGHEICNRCGCCDQVWESCESCAGDGCLKLGEEDLEWGEDAATCATCKGEGGWSVCLGRCDKNGEHEHGTFPVSANQREMESEQNHRDRNQWYGREFCPHPDAPCIDGCSFCGAQLEINEHNHTLQQRNPERYECVCFNC